MASCACANRSRSASAARRSVRSRVTFANPSSLPFGSRSGSMMTFAQKREPSLRTRQPSSSNLPVARATCSSRSVFPLATSSGG